MERRLLAFPRQLTGCVLLQTPWPHRVQVWGKAQPRNLFIFWLCAVRWFRSCWDCCSVAVCEGSRAVLEVLREHKWEMPRSTPVPPAALELFVLCSEGGWSQRHQSHPLLTGESCGFVCWQEWRRLQLSEMEIQVFCLRLCWLRRQMWILVSGLSLCMRMVKG